jgi:hypothetical protein
LAGLVTHSGLVSHAVLLALAPKALFAGFATGGVLSTFTAFSALATFTAVVGFGSVGCTHGLASEVGTIVVCDCDSSGECCAEGENPARDNRGEGDGLAVLRQC